LKGEPIVLTGIGALTAVGAGIRQTAASVRADLAGFTQDEAYFPDPPEVLVEEPQPLRCARALDVESGDEAAVTLAERVLALAIGAVRDLVQEAHMARRELEEAAIVLCLPAARKNAAPLDGARLAAELARRLSLRPRQTSIAIADGGVSTMRAITWARACIAAGDAPRVLVVAADSFLPIEVLDALDGAERLRSERNVDGLIPGEAGAALLLETEGTARVRRVAPIAAVDAVGWGREPNPIGAAANPTGAGLCQAIRQVAAESPGAPFTWALSDMNGESQCSYEWGLARSRLGALIVEPELWHPADTMGDVGAAAGAILCSLAAVAFMRGYAPERPDLTSARALVLCSADNGDRASCILRSLCPPP
jgi:3-oxoacyl-[acyl-carrier-protein] synthase-1